MPHPSQPEQACSNGHFSIITFNGRPFYLECGRFLDIEDGFHPGQSDREREG